MKKSNQPFQKIEPDSDLMQALDRALAAKNPEQAAALSSGLNQVQQQQEKFKPLR